MLIDTCESKYVDTMYTCSSVSIESKVVHVNETSHISLLVNKILSPKIYRNVMSGTPPPCKVNRIIQTALY